MRAVLGGAAWTARARVACVGRWGTTTRQFSTMRGVVVRETGDASKLEYSTAMPVPSIAANQCLVRNEFAGLNFIDTYHRSGLYARELPFVVGTEGAGVVEQVGDQVADLKVGDRVAYNANGSYAEFTAVQGDKLVPVPDALPLDIAATCMVQGMTAHYLVRTTFPLQTGQWCLVHAAAGGTGQLLVQMAKGLGARVIGTCSAGKADIARACGAEVVIDYHAEDVVSKVLEVTKGEGVRVAYDGVGKSTWESSLGSLGVRGMCVLFGNASGAVPPIDPLRLIKKSLFLTRPKLLDHTLTREELLWRAQEVFGWVLEGKVKVRVAKRFALEDVRVGHEFIEGGRTAGKVVFTI